MAKYVIEIEDEPFGRNDDPVIPYGMDELYRAKGFKSLVFDQNGLNKLTPYTELHEQKIRDKAHEEAWEFAKQVSIMKPEDKHKLWGTDKYNTINFGYSYSEAKAAYDAWKADKELIHVGDEVRHNLSEEIAIAIRATSAHVYCIITSGGELGLAQWHICDIAKTGRSFREVVELLEKMREEP